MDTPAAEVLVPLIVFASIFGVDLIAKKDPNRSLKFGLLGLGVGLGLLLGYMLGTYVMVENGDNPLPYLIMVSICGGAALLTHYWIVRKKEGTLS